MRSCLLYPLSPHTVLARLQDSPPPRIIPTFADPRCLSNIRILFAAKEVKLGERVKAGCSPRAVESSSILTGADEDEDGVCPVDCVREFKTDEEFTRFLEKGKESSSLVVVDFYKTACGSCKYIEQGFRKLCKGSSGEELPVVFLKHNVIDEYDEQSEVAERLRIKVIINQEPPSMGSSERTLAVTSVLMREGAHEEMRRSWSCAGKYHGLLRR